MPYQFACSLELFNLDVKEQVVDAMFLAPIFGILELLEGLAGDETSGAEKAPEYSQYPACFDVPECSQQCLVVVGRLRSTVCASRCIVPLLLAYALELVELCLLVLGKMRKMPRRVLERLDAGKVSHGDLSPRTEWMVQGNATGVQRT